MTHGKTCLAAAVAVLAIGLAAPAGAADAVAAKGDAAGASEAAKPPSVPSAVASRLNVGTTRAGRRPMTRTLELIGTVTFVPDRVAIVGPKIGGRVRSLRVQLGERVRAGTVLADIESVELARASADYLATRARAGAAASNAARERDLSAKRISSVREKEAAEADAAALAAQAEAAEQLLLALGLRPEELPRAGSPRPISDFTLRAPIDGAVLSRAVLPGEAVGSGATVFKIADLSRVWVELEVAERDLPWVKPGLRAELVVPSAPGLPLSATVRHTVPEVDRQTRTARIVLEVENSDGVLVPGNFVTARLKPNGDPHPSASATVVPRAAVQTVDGEAGVFVRQPDGGFELRTVELGASGTEDVVVLAGVAPGDEVAVSNAFLLKSEVMR